MSKNTQDQRHVTTSIASAGRASGRAFTSAPLTVVSLAAAAGAEAAAPSAFGLAASVLAGPGFRDTARCVPRACTATGFRLIFLSGRRYGASISISGSRVGVTLCAEADDAAAIRSIITSPEMVRDRRIAHIPQRRQSERMSHTTTPGRLCCKPTEIEV